MPRKSLVARVRQKEGIKVSFPTLSSPCTPTQSAIRVAMDQSASNLLYAPQPPPPKRRRINGNREPSRYSSPDELAASFDHDTPTFHRRTSSKNPSRTSAETQRRSYDDSPPEDSPDELDHTIHTFYRGGLRRNLQPTASRHATPDAPSEISLLTPIQAPASPATSVPPTTPLPPPVNEARYLPYKPKMVLRGHRKGVAAVRFSPKGDKIASCCE